MAGRLTHAELLSHTLLSGKHGDILLQHPCWAVDLAFFLVSMAIILRLNSFCNLAPLLRGAAPVIPPKAYVGHYCRIVITGGHF